MRACGVLANGQDRPKFERGQMRDRRTGLVDDPAVVLVIEPVLSSKPRRAGQNSSDVLLF